MAGGLNTVLNTLTAYQPSVGGETPAIYEDIINQQALAFRASLLSRDFTFLHFGAPATAEVEPSSSVDGDIQERGRAGPFEHEDGEIRCTGETPQKEMKRLTSEEEMRREAFLETIHVLYNKSCVPRHSLYYCIVLFSSNPFCPKGKEPPNTSQLPHYQKNASQC